MMRIQWVESMYVLQYFKPKIYLMMKIIYKQTIGFRLFMILHSKYFYFSFVFINRKFF